MKKVMCVSIVMAMLMSGVCFGWTTEEQAELDNYSIGCVVGDNNVIDFFSGSYVYGNQIVVKCNVTGMQYNIADPLFSGYYPTFTHVSANLMNDADIFSGPKGRPGSAFVLPLSMPATVGSAPAMSDFGIQFSLTDQTFYAKTCGAVASTNEYLFCSENVQFTVKGHNVPDASTIVNYPAEGDVVDRPVQIVIFSEMFAEGYLGDDFSVQLRVVDEVTNDKVYTGIKSYNAGELAFKIDADALSAGRSYSYSYVIIHNSDVLIYDSEPITFATSDNPVASDYQEVDLSDILARIESIEERLATLENLILDITDQIDNINSLLATLSVQAAGIHAVSIQAMDTTAVVTEIDSLNEQIISANSRLELLSKDNITPQMDENIKATNEALADLDSKTDKDIEMLIDLNPSSTVSTDSANPTSSASSGSGCFIQSIW